MKIKKIFILFLISLSWGCSTSKNNFKITEQSHFVKTTIPFENKNGAMFLEVEFGKNKVKKKLKFDTASPFACDSTITNNTLLCKPLKSINSVGVSGDGITFRTRKYIIDTVFVGNVPFTEVTTISILNLSKYQPNSIPYVGLFGTNILKNGIWQIDFKKNQITYTNKIDSLNFSSSYTKLNSHYNYDTDMFQVNMIVNGIYIKNILIDFGSNTMLKLNKKTFDRIDIKHDAIKTTGESITEAGKSNTNYYYLINQNSYIKNKTFQLNVLSSDIAKFNVLGFYFFSQFDSVILDYSHHCIYIKNN